ncbi:hypothetical protein TELCIR_19356, partial [Teladorsagia circumcincta]
MLVKDADVSGIEGFPTGLARSDCHALISVQPGEGVRMRVPREQPSDQNKVEDVQKRESEIFQSIQ